MSSARRSLPCPTIFSARTTNGLTTAGRVSGGDTQYGAFDQTGRQRDLLLVGEVARKLPHVECAVRDDEPQRLTGDVVHLEHHQPGRADQFDRIRTLGQREPPDVTVDETPSQRDRPVVVPHLRQRFAEQLLVPLAELLERRLLDGGPG